MPDFRVLLLQHGYSTVDPERKIVTAAGGEFIDADQLPEKEALRLCEEVEAILVRWLPIPAAMIDRLRRCKIIVRYGIGYDNVDVEAATNANIIVGHVPTYCLDEVSTHTIALLLACVRNITGKHLKMTRGAWDTNPVEPIYRMAGRVLGLVGLGNIARAVVRKMSGWGLRILATDPFVESAEAKALGVELVPLEVLLRESDFVSLHVPLLPETKHLIAARELGLMKAGAVLVNTARGPVLDNNALLEALASGRPGHAGLDVFEEEPLAPAASLRNHPNVIISDHVAWYSEESQLELKRTAAAEAVRVCKGGLPEAIANPDVLDRLGRRTEWTPNYNARWQMKRRQALRVSR
jgi:D-3-phosphoglycerate dehydrogenase